LRKIQVLILRLFLDSGFPAELRGSLQAVPRGKLQAFQGEETLLAVLRQFNQLEGAGEGAQLSEVGESTPSEVKHNKSQDSG
jgi:hypothetical protein